MALHDQGFINLHKTIAFSIKPKLMHFENNETQGQIVDFSTISAAFNSSRTFLIIGDLMVDAYIFGHVDRISPEAPVPIVSVTKRDNRPGGAANVAMNILSLGHKSIICGVIGNDEKGKLLLELLERNEIPTFGILQDKKRPTTTKFRVIGNNVQLLRVDEETTTFLENNVEQDFLNKIKYIINQYPIECIIFQDYDKGCITPRVIEEIVGLALKKNIPVIVDPKKRNFLHYRNVTLFKPNLKEFSDGIKEDFSTENIEIISNSIKAFAIKFNIDFVMVTMSEKGISIYRKENDHFVYLPADIKQVADVSGAGDTVLSVAAICILNKFDTYTTAFISNLAGSIACQYIGVVPIQKNELLKIIESKIDLNKNYKRLI